MSSSKTFLIICLAFWIKSYLAAPPTPQPTLIPTAEPIASSPTHKPTKQPSIVGSPSRSTTLTPSIATPTIVTALHPTSPTIALFDCYYTDCSETVIDATVVPAIEIECGIDMCKQTTVYCPLGTGSICNILCYNNACQNMFVSADNTGTLTITCTASYACEWMKVQAEHAGSISISAKYHDSFADGELWATNAGNVAIICASAANDYACERSKWNLPYEGRNTVFSCYGFGCKDIDYIHAEWDSSWTLTVGVSGCDQCDAKSLCLGTWSITCPTSDTEDSTDSAIFYGNSCSTVEGDYGQRISLCGCEDVVDRVTWIDDSDNDNCVIESEQSEDTSSSNSSLSATITSVLICFFYIVGIAYCIKYGSKNRNRNYISPARGAQPAAMQPATMQQPQVVMQPMQMPPMQMHPRQMQPMQPMQPIQMQPIQQQYIQPVQYVQAPPSYAQAVPQQATGYYPQAQQTVMQPLQTQMQYAASNQQASAPQQIQEGGVTHI